jgi:predicted transport protein
MGANIELWEYRLYENGALTLEEVFKRDDEPNTIEATRSVKNPIMVEAGKKAAATRKSGIQYTFAEHESNAQDSLRTLVVEFREFILSLSDSIEEIPKKLYVAYKVTQNFACLEVHHKKFYLYLKAAKEDFDKIPENARDVRKIGHFGTGDLELTITSLLELEKAKPLVKRALARVGGG